VLRHLVDHCPHVKRVRIDLSLIVDFDILMVRISTLIARATHLTVDYSAPELFETLIERLIQIAQQAGGSLNLTHFTVPWDDFLVRPEGLDGSDDLLVSIAEFVSRLPLLSHCSTPLRLSPEQAGVIFGSVRSLRFLQLGAMHSTTSLPQIRRFDSALSGTEVGLNIACHFGLNLAQALASTPEEAEIEEIFDQVAKAGLQRVEPRHFVDMLMQRLQEGDLAGPDDLFGTLRLKTPIRLLPTLKTVAASLPRGVYLEALLRIDSEDVVFRGHVAMIGFPSESRFEFARVVLKRKFDAAFLDDILVGFTPDLHLRTTYIDAPTQQSLFCHVGSLEALMWLLQSMTEEEAYHLLHLKSVSDPSRAPICDLLPLYEDALAGHFKSVDIFSFPEDVAFFDFAVLSLAEKRYSVFERAAKSMGPRLPPHLAGDLLRLFVKDSHLLNFWITFIHRLEIEPDFFPTNGKRGYYGLGLTPSVIAIERRHTTHVVNALKILQTFPSAIIKSFIGQTADSLPNSLLPEIASILNIFWPTATQEDVEDRDHELQHVFAHIFTPIVRVLAEAGICSSHVVVGAVDGGIAAFPSSLASKTSMLLDLCLQSDFAIHLNAEIRHKNSIRLAEGLMNYKSHLAFRGLEYSDLSTVFGALGLCRSTQSLCERSEQRDGLYLLDRHYPRGTERGFRR
jgi:hypothetical protein